LIHRHFGDSGNCRKLDIPFIEFRLRMLHTVVVDAEALAALDQLFAVSGRPLPRSRIVERAQCRAWHAVPIDAASIVAICHLRRRLEEPFNDTLRHMLDLPPLDSSVPMAGEDAVGRRLQCQQQRRFANG
jgi:hypothetical protein